MKTLIYSLFFISISLNAASIPQAEQERLVLVAEQMGSDQRGIWPTLNWKSSPIIVTFENGDIFAFNLKTANPVWEKMSVKGVQVLYTKQDRWGLKGHHMQSNFAIEGQSAFVYQMRISPSVVHDVAVLAHERFHRHQMENFVLRESPGKSMDHLSEENLTWGEIEDVLLRHFLKSSGMEKLEILKDFVAVNMMRREAIDLSTKQWENRQLKMEGLADYVSTKGYGGESLLLAIYPEVEHESDFIDEAIKWRHYMAGAAIGYALDLLEVRDWKRRAESGEGLPDLLSKSLVMSKQEQNRRIKAVQERLSYQKRRDMMSARVKRYLDRVQHLETQYDKQEGVRVFLGRPRVDISGGGVNDALVYVDSGSVVALNDSSVASTNDGKWTFETKNISHLYQHERGIREVKIDKQAVIHINQVKFSLDELMREKKREYPFKHLKIQCNNSSLDSKEHAGVLVIDDSGLHVKYF